MAKGRNSTLSGLPRSSSRPAAHRPGRKHAACFGKPAQAIYDWQIPPDHETAFPRKRSQMSQPLEVLRLIVVSPADVTAERELVRRVVQSLNLLLRPVRNMQIDVWGWETGSYPTVHQAGPQGAIDAVMHMDTADIVVGIFWTRFGTPTMTAPAGTEHELRRALERWQREDRPKIMLYFNEKESRPRNAEESTQLTNVLRFREELPPELFPWTYNGPEDFEAKFRDQLALLLTHEYAPTSGPSEQPAARTVPGRNVLQQEVRDLGLFDPPWSGDFIPRKSESDGLKHLLAVHPLVIMQGLSGSGKTYLAAAYANTRARETYRGRVLWYHSQGGETLDDLLTEISLAMPVVGNSTFSRCRSMLQLLRQSDALLVIDDFHKMNAESCRILVDSARAAGEPARLLLVSTTYVFTGPDPQTGRLSLSGFDRSEMESFLDSRKIGALSPHILDDLITRTGGLPIALSFFSTLVSEFGYAPDELLAGSLVESQLVQDWFRRIMSSLPKGAVQLLQGLSACDAPFNRGVIRALAEFYGVRRADTCFEALQHAFLVQQHTGYTWRVHPLIAQFSLGELRHTRRVAVHAFLAEYFLSRIVWEGRGVLPDWVITLKMRAARHLSAGGRYPAAEKVVREIASSLKIKGRFDSLLELSREQIEWNPARSPWTDYNYAHSCLITGRLSEALETARRLHDDYAVANGPPPISLASARLYAEVLDDLGRTAEGVAVLTTRFAHTDWERVGAAVWSQARSIHARLLMDTGALDEAALICEEMIRETRDHPNLVMTAVPSTILGTIFMERGDLERAKRLLAGAVAKFRESSSQRGQAWALFQFALCQHRMGRSYFELALSDSLRLRADITECSRTYLEGMLGIVRAVSDPQVSALLDQEIDRVTRTRSRYSPASVL